MRCPIVPCMAGNETFMTNLLWSSWGLGRGRAPTAQSGQSVELSYDLLAARSRFVKSSFKIKYELSGIEADRRAPPPQWGRHPHQTWGLPRAPPATDGR